MEAARRWPDLVPVAMRRRPALSHRRRPRDRARRAAWPAAGSSPMSSGGGTTLYTAPLDEFAPRFGSRSAELHREDGAHPIAGALSSPAPRRRRPPTTSRRPSGSGSGHTPSRGRRRPLPVGNCLRAGRRPATRPQGRWLRQDFFAAFLAGRLLGGRLLRCDRLLDRSLLDRSLLRDACFAAAFFAGAFFSAAFFAEPSSHRLLGSDLLGRRLLRRVAPGSSPERPSLARSNSLFATAASPAAAAASSRGAPKACFTADWHARMVCQSAPAVNFGTTFFLVLIQAPVFGPRTKHASPTSFLEQPKAGR